VVTGAALSADCNSLQLTTTHCNKLQQTATHCKTLQQNRMLCHCGHWLGYCCSLQHTENHCNTLQHTASRCTPLMEEIRLEIFGSPKLSVLLIDLLSDGDSVHSRGNLFDFWWIPVKTFYMFIGTESLLEILAVVTTCSPISSIHGHCNKLQQN